MRRLLVLCSAAMLLFPACGELLDPAAAVVDGDKITVEEIQVDLDRFEESAEFERLSEQGDPQALKRQVEQQLLSQAIRRAVLVPRAEDLGIEITEQDIQERLEAIKADFPSEGAFEEALKEQGLTLAQLTELVADNLLEEQLRAKVTEDAGPSDEELQAYYDENIEDFQETEAQHILVEDQATAKKVAGQLAKASSGKVDGLFAKLAKKLSIDESNAADAGELGYTGPGAFVKPFEDAIAGLGIGEISRPVKTEFGFHVIRVTDRREIPFEDASAQITEQLGAGAADEAWNAYVEKAYDEAEVKVNPRYGEFDEDALLVVDPTSEDVPGAEDTLPSPGASVNAGESPAAE